MTFLEQELHRLFDQTQAMDDVWIVGNVCYGRLSDAVRVKIQFASGGVAEQYDALKVTLLNRCEGLIDSLSIKFCDIWGLKKTTNPNFKDGIYPHIWVDGGQAKWYVYQPVEGDYKRLSEAVSDYLGVFREPVQTPRMEQQM